MFFYLNFVYELWEEIPIVLHAGSLVSKGGEGLVLTFTLELLCSFSLSILMSTIIDLHSKYTRGWGFPNGAASSRPAC